MEQLKAKVNLDRLYILIYKVLPLNIAGGVGRRQRGLGQKLGRGRKLSPGAGLLHCRIYSAQVTFILFQLDGDSPAIFGVPQPAPHPSQPQQQIPPVSFHPIERRFNWEKKSILSNQPSMCLLQARLEEYPEFEYLRNILFQYMCGRQPLILVKVLSAIVKFTPEQV